MVMARDMATPPHKWRKRASSLENRAHFNAILSISEAHRMYVWHTRPMYADVHPYSRYTLAYTTHYLNAHYAWERALRATDGRE